MSERPPYEAYAAIMGLFAAALGIAGGLARRLDRDPQCQTPIDLFTLSVATFKAARTIARDDVASFIREPFVEGEAGAGDEEEPVEGGMQQALGELVTCSRCTGTWAAAGLAATQILAPRFGRLLTWSLAAAGINDFLQASFSVLTSKANVLEEKGAGLSWLPRARSSSEPLESTG
jgi:Protein of unknown function (DUF1360)